MQSQRTHWNTIRFSRFRWIKYAKSLGKTCQITSTNPKQAEKIGKF